MRTYKFLLFSIFFGILIISCSNKLQNPEILSAKKDSISNWIKNSKNTTLKLSIRKQYLSKSYSQLKELKTDGITIKLWSDIAYQELKLKDTFLFKKINKEGLWHAMRLKDSFFIADMHWNYASYYNNKEVYDSAYYHFNVAEKYFVNYKEYYAKMLIGKAYIQNQFSDYVGSEIYIVKTIKIFKELNKYKELSNSYNSLAVIQFELEEYDAALLYFKKALEYSKKANFINQFSINNNIGLTYQKKGEYTTAISYFKKDLDTKLKQKLPLEYARITDNIAYTSLLNKDTLGIEKKIQESLHIRDSLQSTDGLITSYMHLSEYYRYKKDKINAKLYVLKANNLAKQIKNNRDYLSTLKSLAELDSKNSTLFLKKYISFKDSLQITERKILNKFSRISLETNEYKAKTASLFEQIKWLSIVGISILILTFFLYSVRTQKIEKEKLILETEQQRANEQVYLLTLQQQTELEKEKVNERNRISEELHDGILSKLFGTRIGLGFLDINSSKSVKEKHELFLDELQTIEKEIRDVSHKLNNNFDSSNINFTTIIHKLVEGNSELGNFTFELDFKEITDWYKINEIIKVNLYRIIQESLQNIIKHAKAKKVTILFSSKESNLVLSITDNGAGFIIKKKEKGIGIKNIKSRVVKLNGKFKIYSKPNEGTKIVIEIPIK
ncbi:tetratricopeptide repeat-containing sensor histidine kinase [Polaribacter sp.]|uniref:tetratricopeptide repeat-containing sensor histidine kinase n=1 Tax=Polaribacter sp. TaxID=1920175 RepID=UPI003EFAF5B6